VASHDLQEPLRKIQSFGDVLKNQYANELGTGKDYIDRMQAAAKRMSVLIRDLLNYSRINTRQNKSAPVVLNDIIELLLTDMEVAIRETNARPEVGPLPVIEGDVTQLSQLFQNLLSNALKFRDPNRRPLIQVTCQRVTAADLPVSVQPSRAAAAYYRIDVVDNGIGFDEQYANRIFQVFQRLHSKSQYAGTGIGLAICEKVAANHGGGITARSQPGQGATFSVYFPV
jgi:light-regulated signal transduction histidine kinase (bacteriophytochrome)